MHMITILFIHQRPNEIGLGSALRGGFRIAFERFPFKVVVQIDGDLSQDPSFIPEILQSDANVVVGSRYVDGVNL